MDEVGEGFDREIVLADGGAERDVHRVLRFTGVHTIEFAAPPVKES
jgi:hypothetical protein